MTRDDARAELTNHVEWLQVYANATNELAARRERVQWLEGFLTEPDGEPVEATIVDG